MSNSNKLVLFAEKIIFSNRLIILSSLILLCVVLTFQAIQVKSEASFVKMLPTNHQFIKNFLSYKKELANLGNVVRVIVENKNGDIFDADYQEVLKNVTDDVFSSLVLIVMA